MSKEDNEKLLHDPKYTDKHVLKAYTSSTTKNIQSIVQYTKETRKMLRDLEKTLKNMQFELQQKSQEIQGLNARIAVLQQKTFAGGTTSV